MLAPEPFFEPRGTPFSEYHRIRALCELGYRVDLVTYPFGRDVRIPRLEIFRCPRPPFVRGVRIGPSAIKILLDLLLAVTAARLARTRRYDAIHSHEEAGVLGLWLAKRLRVPHLYDMHSSLPQQLGNFGYTRSGLVRRLFERIETTMIARSRVVITICRELQDTAVALGAGDRAFLIENVMGGDVEGGGSFPPAELRARYGLRPDQPVVLYTGTFEPYQGLDLLFDAAAVLGGTHPRARVLVVGGTRDQVEDARRRAVTVSSSLIFAGQRPAHEIPRLPGCLRRSGVPADERHEHAPEDLLLPAVGTADRGDRPANAHPGARRRHRPARAAGHPAGRSDNRPCRSGGKKRTVSQHLLDVAGNFRLCFVQKARRSWNRRGEADEVRAENHGGRDDLFWRASWWRHSTGCVGNSKRKRIKNMNIELIPHLSFPHLSVIIGALFFLVAFLRGGEKIKEWTGLLEARHRLFLGIAGFAFMASGGYMLKNNVPEANFSFSPTGHGTQGLTSYSFDASSSLDLDDDQLIYTWNFGDGSAEHPTRKVIATHVYGNTGTFTVTLDVSDGKGGRHAKTRDVTVNRNIGGSCFSYRKGEYDSDLDLTQATVDIDGKIVRAVMRLRRSGQNFREVPLSGRITSSNNFVCPCAVRLESDELEYSFEGSLELGASTMVGFADLDLPDIFDQSVVTYSRSLCLAEF